MHTHCENPEYFEAADEVGIMIQPELPYYGAGKDAADQPKPELNHMSRGPHNPKQDLKELVAHYRRYTSLAIYCGGNESWIQVPLDRQLYQLAKALDPTRPWLCLDGGGNVTRDNSELATSATVPRWHPSPRTCGRTCATNSPAWASTRTRGSSRNSPPATRLTNRWRPSRSSSAGRSASIGAGRKIATTRAG